MARVVYVGDPHATAGEVDDCRALMGRVRSFAREVAADRVTILGDLHHTHAVVRLEVVSMWREELSRLVADDLEVVVLKGNHDASQDGRHHILVAYRDLGVTVVDAPLELGGVLHLPYMARKEDFVAACCASGSPVVVCHQLFDGSRYENGFYAGEEGVDQADVPQERVISGHVHDPQEFGKVWYVGAPRWRSASDANKDRHVWAVDHGEDGRFSKVCGEDTSRCCRKIVHLEDRPGAPAALPEAGPLIDVRVDVYGTSASLPARVEEVRAACPGARVRPFRTDPPAARARESEGVRQAFSGYLQSFTAKGGTPTAVLERMADERIWGAATW
jgi:hypothetical protein